MLLIIKAYGVAYKNTITSSFLEPGQTEKMALITIFASKDTHNGTKIRH